MTPEQFVAKWSACELSEKAASHEHFIDLCQMLGVPTPASSDPTGQDYCFEKPVRTTAPASKGSKGDYGFVDVWKRNCFAWEYKRKDKYKSLDDAYRQLYQYRDDLENPPLSVVCDISNTVIHTHFQGYPKRTIILKLEEIPGNTETLRRLFNAPDSFKPAKTAATLTQDVAEEFGKLADALRDRFPDTGPGAVHPHHIAHFLMKIIFCLFAEGIDLLPGQAFKRLIKRCQLDAESGPKRLDQLFTLMRTGGEFGNDLIPWFNGGLFDDAPAIPLKYGDFNTLAKIAEKDWSGVEPSIFGTLFERILDPNKRAQIGAHYTGRDDILLVVEPVVMAPLRRRWQTLQDELQPAIDQIIAHCQLPANPRKTPARHAERTRETSGPEVQTAPLPSTSKMSNADFKTLRKQVENKLQEFRHYLATLRILDPACGSGNFLYVALQLLLDLDYEIQRFATRCGIPLPALPYIRPSQTLHGIEINAYASELAQVVIWIGYIQWLRDHGLDVPNQPILDKLQSIENRDAILDFLPSAAGARSAASAPTGSPSTAAG
ncbi:MAG: DNA methyltransferase, partial [Tepidisphaeraceae bacterium]